MPSPNDLPPGVVRESSGITVGRIVQRILTAVVGVLPIAVGAFLVHVGWTMALASGGRGELATLTAVAEAEVVDAFWRFPLGPSAARLPLEQMSETAGLEGYTRPRLCARLRLDLEGDPEALACRTWRTVQGPWVIAEAELAPGVSLPWIGATGEPLVELRFPADAHAKLSRLGRFPWPITPQTEEARRRFKSGSQLDALWIAVDEPLERLLHAWSMNTPMRLEARYDPNDPSRALPVALLQEAAPPAETRPIGYAIAAFGAVFWLMGFQVALHPMPRLVRLLVGAAALATAILWAPRLDELVGRLSPQAAEIVEDVRGMMIGTPPLPVVADLDTETARDDVVLQWSFETSGYADVLAPFDLERPSEAADADAVLRAIVDAVAAQTAALPSEESAALFGRLAALQEEGRSEVALLSLPAARAIVLDPAREGTIEANAAWRFLQSSGLETYAPTPARPAYAERRRIWESLLDVPDNVVVNTARYRLE